MLHVCRGHVYVLGWRQEQSAEWLKASRWRLTRVMPDGEHLVMWETHLRTPESHHGVQQALIGNRFGLWGLLTPVPGIGHGEAWWRRQPDRWLSYDGRIVRCGVWPGRAVGAVGVTAWAGERECLMAATPDVAETDAPGIDVFGPRTYTLFKTPRTLCVYEVGVEWSLEPGAGWDHRPQVDAVTVEYGDGSGTNRPTVGSVEVAWGDGSGENEP